MNMMSTMSDELSRIADECDARGLFDIANEIDAALKDSAMRKMAGRPPRTMDLLRFLGSHRITNLSNRFAQVEGPDPFGDEMTDEETAAFHAQQREEDRRKEEGLMSNMSPEDLRFLTEEGMTREDFERMQAAEIAAERESDDSISGFRHLGDEERNIEDQMRLESFEEFMNKIRNANRRIDSSIPRRIDSSTNRFADHKFSPMAPAVFSPEPERIDHGYAHLDPFKDDEHRLPRELGGPTPYDDPDFVSQEELEAASDLLESLLNGKTYEGKEFCPDCNMVMRDDASGEGKHCPHCSLRGQPRISMNMGSLPAGYVRTTENISPTLERMR
jgi:hypothetical protein